jgi:hypothetical protein
MAKFRGRFRARPTVAEDADVSGWTKLRALAEGPELRSPGPVAPRDA